MPATWRMQVPLPVLSPLSSTRHGRQERDLDLLGLRGPSGADLFESEAVAIEGDGCPFRNREEHQAARLPTREVVRQAHGEVLACQGPIVCLRGFVRNVQWEQRQ